MSINTAEPAPRIRPTRDTQRAAAVRVVSELTELCTNLQPGTKLPSHTELMASLAASERTILSALEQIRRDGWIVRRPGAGTFVAERPASLREPVAESSTDTSTLTVICRPDNSYFARCAEMLHQHAEAMGLSVICRFLAPSTPVSLEQIVSIPSPLGYILIGWDLLPLAKSLQDAGHRVIALTAPALGEWQEVPCVHADNEQGGYLAAKHLIDLGHERIAFAMVDTHPERSIRWTGHCFATREAQRAGKQIVSSTLLRSTVEGWRECLNDAAEFFQQPDAPTGLVVWNDREAVKLLTILLRAGVRVPEDVSIVGYDNLPVGETVSPALTTIDQALGQQIRMSLRLLMQDNAPSSSHTVVVTPALVMRSSTASLTDH
jgi:DNA-binding LacI/PurR family transcriptional regulator